jgi:hypothetical protein
MQMGIVDEVVLVSTKEAESHARQAALTQGLLVRFITAPGMTIYDCCMRSIFCTV